MENHITKCWKVTIALTTSAPHVALSSANLSVFRSWHFSDYRGGFGLWSQLGGQISNTCVSASHFFWKSDLYLARLQCILSQIVQLFMYAENLLLQPSFLSSNWDWYVSFLRESVSVCAEMLAFQHEWTICTLIFQLSEAQTFSTWDIIPVLVNRA